MPDFFLILFIILCLIIPCVVPIMYLELMPLMASEPLVIPAPAGSDSLPNEESQPDPGTANERGVPSEPVISEQASAENPDNPAAQKDAVNDETPEATFTGRFGEGPVSVDNYAELLGKLGYLHQDTEDEGLNIRNAVIHFQAEHNLVVDGDFGLQSMETLKKRLSGSAFLYKDKIAAPPCDSLWMVINKSKRILTLYNGSAVVKKYPIAVGNPPSLTPDGKFNIVNKMVDPAWGGGGYAQPIPGGVSYNPLGYRWIGISYGGGYSYGVHGNSSPYSIGSDVSHGCVRMCNSDVEELFELIPVGIDLWIGTEDLLNLWSVSQEVF